MHWAFPAHSVADDYCSCECQRISWPAREVGLENVGSPGGRRKSVFNDPRRRPGSAPSASARNPCIATIHWVSLPVRRPPEHLPATVSATGTLPSGFIPRPEARDRDGYTSCCDAIAGARRCGLASALLGALNLAGLAVPQPAVAQQELKPKVRFNLGANYDYGSASGARYFAEETGIR
jgi:hypothetical protein